MPGLRSGTGGQVLHRSSAVLALRHGNAGERQRRASRRHEDAGRRKFFSEFFSIFAAVFFEKREISETIDGGNEHLVKCSNKPDGRETFYKDAAAMSYKQLIKKYQLQLSFQRTLYRRLVKKIRSFLGWG